VSKIIDPARGRKRKVRQVRWKRADIVSVILFALAIAILSVSLAWWLTTHPFD
jgi:energy-coupling factor transporter transmembrane protein EcfT